MSNIERFLSASLRQRRSGSTWRSRRQPSIRLQSLDDGRLEERPRLGRHCGRCRWHERRTAGLRCGRPRLPHQRHVPASKAKTAKRRRRPASTALPFGVARRAGGGGGRGRTGRGDALPRNTDDFGGGHRRTMRNRSLAEVYVVE